jgi:tryptophanyl-tRNA synthetase
MFSLRTLHRAAPSPSRICINCLRRYSVAAPPKEKLKKRKVIFSGIQPTGVPHLGNYLGALRQWVKLQDEASEDTTLLFSIVDLHAITIKQDPSELARWRKEMLASLFAVGLDPKRSIIFAQSSVKQHAELMWILSCGASMGYLGRMTQWKVCDNLQHSRGNSYADVVLRANCHSRPTPPRSTPQTTKTLSNSVSSPTPSCKLLTSSSTTQPTFP